ncbi:ABC transporter permease protein [Azorhizobium caulinodans ORS 571]|uniref:ABC transporter permease protein n=1 Tax=Azorhizobium caulinodans (strain ATCC 43989 / DSM 5975 / JCM 20966 / LMG 6465 / NBRC 14845 / NCIMB 13405 / ORS 571) TaxID=438753 RepID=A8I8G9_AZOC5|nr:ABC transporter permease subunit [Azorhizobium caulinodans]BAF88659.1 ABC transporter permease protein [Azorhizobium caulinodans ORS 571]
MTKSQALPAPATLEHPSSGPAALPAAGTGDLANWPNVHAPDAARATEQAVERLAPSGRHRALRAFLTNPNAVAGSLILLAVLAAALAAPILYPDDPLEMAGRPLIWPGQSPEFPLGTDALGRDVAAGVFHGARVSLLVGAMATIVSLLAGTLVGALAGYFGGRTDDVLVKLIEVFQTIPGFILLIVLVAIAQPSIPAITLAIGLVSWPSVARLVRAQFRSLREKDFVMAARGLGYGHGRIIFREILPNALPPVIVMASVTVATAILMESALSFMGLGDPNVVSWGSMIGAGREMLRTAWYLSAVPGLAIVFTVLSLNLIGDGLNDALNPRLSGERR